MDEKLIEQIVKAVLAKLKNPGSEMFSSKKKALVIGKINECSNTFEKLKNRYAIDEVTSESRLSDYEAIILPSLSCIQISAIWNCLPSDETTKWSIDAILSQKPILVLKDTVQLNDESIKVGSKLFKRVLGYFEELKNDGLMYVDELVLNSNTVKKNENEFSKAKQENKEKFDKATYENRLLNEQEVSKFENKGIKELSIGKKTIITPLAKDLLRNLKIKIIQE